MRLRKQNENMAETEIELMAQVSDALAHPARIRIFRFIMKCNKDRILVCNKDVVQEFDYAQATISQHLKTLVNSGLVEAQKKEKYTYYFVNIGVLMNYLDITKKFE
jgi:ArsR family transcriptional regulator, arsenate/arsenite/antimonite-responsive transcriptional repressor